MKKFITILTLLSSFNASAYISVGYFHGVHFPETGLNNSHPFIEVADTILVYRNSFNRTGVAVYGTIGDGPLKLKMGLTTGYNKREEYKDYVYKQPLCIRDNLSVMIAPVLEFENSSGLKLMFAVLGNSLNAGIGVNF